eukprot:CCRYP_018577-RA/>CCRYP_018577-RA protein AED:0.06 eAED:0.06 QI:0/0/0/0.33/1/1/3/0/483
MHFSILAIAIIAHGAKCSTVTSFQGSNPHPFDLTSVPHKDRKDEIVFPTSDAVRPVAQGSAVAHYEQTTKAFLPNLSQKLYGPRTEPDRLVNTQGRKMKSSDWVQLGLDIDGEDDSDYFGVTISLSGDGNVLAVGAPYHSSDAGHVRVFQFNGTTGWSQLGLSIDGEAEGDEFGSSVCLSSDGSVLAIGAPYNGPSGLYEAGNVRVFQFDGTGWSQLGHSIDGEAQGGNFGSSVCLSSDGSVLAIGAPYSGYTADTGYVRVFQFNGTGWTQLGLSIDGAAAWGGFGSSVTLSSDGSVLAIGAPKNRAPYVRVFQFNGPIGWSQLGLSIDGEAEWDEFGSSVCLSSDGSVLAIGAPNHYPSGLDGAGNVRVFQFNDTGWSQLGLSIDGEAEWDQFGWSVALSSDGNMLAIGAPYHRAGHVRVFQFNGTGWTQLGLNIDGETENDRFGRAVSLSSNGRMLAVGAPENNPNGLTEAGSVGVYKGHS